MQPHLLLRPVCLCDYVALKFRSLRPHPPPFVSLRGHLIQTNVLSQHASCTLNGIPLSANLVRVLSETGSVISAVALRGVRLELRAAVID